MALKFKCSKCGARLEFQHLGIGDQGKCKFCGADVIVPESAELVKTDPSSNYPESPIEREALRKERVSSLLTDAPKPPSSKKYPALRIISGFIKLVAFLSILLCVVIFFWIQQHSSGFESVFSYLYLAGGVISFVLMWASAEILKLFVDIEMNTRQTRDAIYKLYDKQ